MHSVLVLSLAPRHVHLARLRDGDVDLGAVEVLEQHHLALDEPPGDDLRVDPAPDPLDALRVPAAVEGREEVDLDVATDHGDVVVDEVELGGGGGGRVHAVGLGHLRYGVAVVGVAEGEGDLVGLGDVEGTGQPPALAPLDVKGGDPFFLPLLHELAEGGDALAALGPLPCGGRHAAVEHLQDTGDPVHLHVDDHLELQLVGQVVPLPQEDDLGDELAEVAGVRQDEPVVLLLLLPAHVPLHPFGIGPDGRPARGGQAVYGQALVDTPPAERAAHAMDGPVDGEGDGIEALVAALHPGGEVDLAAHGEGAEGRDPVYGGRVEQGLHQDGTFFFRVRQIGGHLQHHAGAIGGALVGPRLNQGWHGSGFLLGICGCAAGLSVYTHCRPGPWSMRVWAYKTCRTQAGARYEVVESRDGARVGACPGHRVGAPGLPRGRLGRAGAGPSGRPGRAARPQPPIPPGSPAAALHPVRVRQLAHVLCRGDPAPHRLVPLPPPPPAGQAPPGPPGRVAAAGGLHSGLVGAARAAHVRLLYGQALGALVCSLLCGALPLGRAHALIPSGVHTPSGVQGPRGRLGHGAGPGPPLPGECGPSLRPGQHQPDAEVPGLPRVLLLWYVPACGPARAAGKKEGPRVWATGAARGGGTGHRLCVGHLRPPPPLPTPGAPPRVCCQRPHCRAAPGPGI
eukprot:768373-Hanusia_phi.AAC.21